jgi:hypothetical protein
MTSRLVYLLAFCFPLGSMTALYAGDNSFPTSDKGIQAVIVAISGRDTSKALAIGQVQITQLREFCNRDPGGMTNRYGGTMTIDQCVTAMLAKEGGKKYSASADCPRKTVTAHWGNTYRLASKRIVSSVYTEYYWRDEHSGILLDGSSASMAPTVTRTYEMLCPGFY